MAVDMLVFIEEKLAIAEIDELDIIGHVDEHVLWFEIFVAKADFVVHWS